MTNSNTPASGSALGALAAFLAETPAADIPRLTMERAADCVLDCLAAAAAGSREPVVETFKSVMISRETTGNASLWFKDGTADLVSAAAVNALAATILDIDDGHRRAKGHAGAAVISAALAAAEEADSSYRDFLAAVVMGYEAAVRVAVARAAERQVDTASGIWSGIGAAVAVARIAGATPQQMAQAILIAEQHSPQLASAMLHGFAGADVKEGIPWSVVTGSYAARLALAGFTGYPNTFDLPELYQPGALAGDLDAFAVVPGTYIKPYACCRWIHSAIDGVLAILATEKLDRDGIEQIEVRTFHRAVRLANEVAPRTMVDAQFSIPFCVALACVGGREALLPLDTAALANAEVVKLASTVKPILDQEMEEMFPVFAPAIVSVLHNGRTYTQRVDAAFGEPSNPMSRQDIFDKFVRLAEPSFGRQRLAALAEALASDSSEPDVRLRSLLSPHLQSSR